jgi:hypothetical protein
VKKHKIVHIENRAPISSGTKHDSRCNLQKSRVKEIEQDIKKGLSWVRKTENVDQHLRSYL